MRPGEEALFEEFLMYTEIEVNSDYTLYSMFHALLFSCSNLSFDFRRDVLEFKVNDKLVHGIVLVCIKPLSYISIDGSTSGTGVFATCSKLASRFLV